MRIVISGGTGLIGRAVGHALVGRGADAIVLTRSPRPPLAHKCAECGVGGRVEFVRWAPEEPGEWMSAVDGADVVIHLAGASVADNPWTDERKAVLRSSRIESTKLIAKAIVEAKEKPKLFVSASAIGHYGMKTGDRVLTEDDPAGDDFLARLTCDWEAAADPVREAGVRVVHPRFGLVLGERGGIYAKMTPLFRAFVGGPIGGGRQYMPWVHIRDVAHAIETLIDRSDLAGAFNVVGPEPVTMNTFAEALGRSLRRPSLMRVPPFAVKMALGAEAAEAILTGQRALPKRLADAGFAFVFPDIHSALADLANG